MDVKKYRLYLLLIMLGMIMIGILSYLYFFDEGKEYQDGTLVFHEMFTEEEGV